VNLKLDELIRKSIATFEINNGIEKMWKTPLTAALPEDHPLIPELRRAVSIDHLLPGELLSGAKSVVVFFVPFDDTVIESNLRGEAASEEWACAYVLTNELLGFINDEIEKIISKHGFHTVKIKATHNFDKKTLMSRWSHRHIAWIAGLGTFGINNMLITSKGCCGRFGSLVTNVDSQELGIQYSDSIGRPMAEKCLNKIDGSCGLCKKKCKSGAFEEAGGFDRRKCFSVCLKNAELYRSFNKTDSYSNGIADVCGKCLVGLPCSNRDPSSR
jgi:epoxyqueuosine reductase QueG